MRVRHIRSVHELKPADWERLSSGRTVYLGRPWLEWAERSDDYESQYLLAEEPDGSVVGALPTYFWRGGSGVSMNQAYHPLDLLAVPRLGTEAEADRHLWMPLLLLGSRAGYHGGVLVDPTLPPSSRARVIARLIQAAAELAETLGASAMALLYAPQAHAEECLAALAACAPDVPAPSYAPLSAEAVIPVATVDSERSARRRREWRREARAFADSGGSVHRVRLSECYREAGPLLGLLQRRYGADDTDESMTAYLGQQAACLDPWSEVFLERRDGRLTGFALCYLWGDTLHVRAAGFAQDAGPYAYFNLAVYEPLALAASLGLAWLDLGTGAYRGKILRGARLRTTHALVWAPRGSRESVRSALLLPGEDYLDAIS